MNHNASFDSRIVPGATWEHLEPSRIEQLRSEAVARDPSHPWRDLSNEALVRAAGLVCIGREAEGVLEITVAGILILGTREAVRTFLPSHRTQAVYRPGNWKRGNREDLRANLLETFEALMAFAGRHLPEQGASLEEKHGQGASLRDALFAEIFAHSLASRDYAKPYPARFVIEADRVFMEHGVAVPENEVDPVPNPVIASVFRQIGRSVRPGAEGSAVAAMGKAYFGIRPLIVTGTVYRILAPFPRPTQSAPAQSPNWDIAHLLETQAPWTHAKAAQAEIALNQSVLDAMLGPQGSGPTELAGHVPTPQAAPMMSPSPAASPAVTHTPVTPTERPPETRPTPSIAPIMAPVIAGTTSAPAASATGSTADRTAKILEFCKTPRYRSEVQAHIGIVNRDYFRKDILNPLIEKGLLRPTLPDKPNSPNQQYATVVPVTVPA